MKTNIKFTKNILLTLTLTSLLSGGIGLTANNSASAFPTRISQSTESVQQSSKLPKPIANAILRDASKRSGVAIRQLKITKVTQKTFGNSCEFNFGEVCTREYRPIEGWEVVVRVQQQSWNYHVDKTGKQIVLDPKVNASAILPKAIANAILRDASKHSRVPKRQLQITKVTQKTFGNSCQFNFGEVCTQQFDPVEGWEVVVRVQQQSWTYHVNKTGKQIVLDPKVSATAKK